MNSIREKAPLNIFEGRPHLWKAATNTGWIFGEKALRMAIGLLVGAWVARYLGPAQLGRLHYAASFVAIFMALSAMGLNAVVVRKLVGEPDEANTTLGSAFFLQLAAGVIAGILAVAVSLVYNRGDKVTILLVAILASTLIFKASEVIRYWFEAQVRSKYAVLAEGVAFTLASAVKLALILLGASLIAFGWALFFESVVVFVALIWIYRKTGGHFRAWRITAGGTSGLLHDAWPLILSSVFVSINMNADKIILMRATGAAELGLFTAANTLVSIWFFLPIAVGSSIAPRLTEMYIKDKYEYFANSRRAYAFFLAGSGLFAGLVSLLSKPILYLLFGPKFSGASLVLSIMIWGVVFVSQVSLRGRLLVIEKEQKYVPILIFCGVATNLLLLALLTPRYGITGAACAFVASWALNAFFFPFLIKRTRHHAKMAMGLPYSYED